MAAEDHETTTQKVKDPFLGPCWVVVCSWCGAFGRFELELDAQSVAERHHEKKGFEKT